MNKHLLQQAGRALVAVLAAATCAYWGFRVSYDVGYQAEQRLVLITTGYVARRDAR